MSGTALFETRLADVTELFCEGESASLSDGLVWKTVCRTGTWKLSPLPGGEPLVIDEELFDDVIAAFDQGAWEHVTVPLSHDDRTDENTGFVRKLLKKADPTRAGQWLLRAGIEFTEPDIKGKVLRGSIANTSVGVTLRGILRPADKRFFPRVLKHVALTNKPWLDGLEPFGSDAMQIAASLDAPIAYEFDYTETVPGIRDGQSTQMTGADGEVVWNADEDIEAVRSELDNQLSMYDVRPDGTIGTLDDLDADSVLDAWEPHSGPHTGMDSPTEVGIADPAYIRGMSWDKVLIGCYPTTPGMGEEYAWVAPFQMTDAGPELSAPDEWTKVERSWHALSRDYPIVFDDMDIEFAMSIGEALRSGDEERFRELILEWNPSLHPRWPGHTPGGKGGEFVSTKGILDRLLKNPSGTLNVSFLSKGSDRIQSLTASRGSTDKVVSFTARLNDGSSKNFDVPVTSSAFDTARVIGALKEVDTGGAKTHGAGDFRQGQSRPAVDPFLEALTTEAENDPTLHPPIKKGRVTTELLGSAAPGSGSRRPVPDGGYANTQQKWSVGGTVDPKTGEVRDGKWLLDRKEMHDKAIAFYLQGKTPDPGGKKALFFAGGTASGKSTALGSAGDVAPPEPHTVHIDPDELKKWIPEYRQAALARDRYASSMAHEESSVMAKRLYDEATKAGLNIIVDGTGDSGGDKFLQKLRRAKSEGYDVSVFMVDAPTEIAVPRSVLRGHRTGRFVPLEILRETHSNVSRAHLTWRNDAAVSSWQLWSTAAQGGAAVKVADGGGGKTIVHDAPVYTEMLGKGGVEVASKALRGPGVQHGAAGAPAEVLATATDAEKAALSRIGQAHGPEGLRHAAAVIQSQKDPNASRPIAPKGVDAAAVEKMLPGPDLSQGVPAAVHAAQQQLDQAFTDWKSRRAYVDKRGNYLLRPEGQTTGGGGSKAPWSDLIKRLFPDSLAFHKAAHDPNAPKLQASPIAAGGVAFPVPSSARVDPSKLKAGARVQFERGGKFLKGVVQKATGPAGSLLVKVGDQVITVPRQDVYLLSHAAVRITDPSDELRAAFNPSLHPRGLKGTKVGGKFIRRLFDAAQNGNVVAINEAAHSIEVSVQGGRKYHIEPAGSNGVRVIVYDGGGNVVRTSLHTVASIETDFPELKGLTGLIRKKVRGRRGLVGRSKSGIKVIAHYGDNQLAASRRDDRGGEHMADNDDGTEGGEVLELSQEQLQEMIATATAEGRKEVELKLAKQQAELRGMRVDRRIRELEDDGHIPAVLKVARQLMLADDHSDDETLTLSLPDADGNAVEKKVSWTGGIEALLAAIPEDRRALDHAQPDVKARADAKGTGEEKTVDERADEAWKDMHDGSAVTL